MKKRSKKIVQAKTNQPDNREAPARTNQPRGDRWLLDDIDDEILRQAWLDVAQQREKEKQE
jgi:hypothetical protein